MKRITLDNRVYPPIYHNVRRFLEVARRRPGNGAFPSVQLGLDSTLTLSGFGRLRRPFKKGGHF